MATWIIFNQLKLYQVVVALQLLLLSNLNDFVDATCQSPQYAELGTTATIECMFDVDTDNVYWYNNNDTYPFIRYEKGTIPPISGSGFANYSIDHNGSLIIFDVTRSDEGTYKVISYNRKDQASAEHNVAVHTTAVCGEELPTIDVCKSQKSCLITSDDLRSLSCSFGCARPAVELTWYIKHEGYMERMEAEQTETSDGKFTFTSISNIKIYNSLKEPLTHLVCEARGPAIAKLVLESSVYIDNSSDWKNTVSTFKYYQINSQAILPCASYLAQPSTFIWEKTTGNLTEVMMFSKGGTPYINTAKSWRVTDRGVLILSPVDLTSEGTYRCKFFDGGKFGIYERNVTVLVTPSPPFLLVVGCPQTTQPCSIQINLNTTSFNLNCSVSEVYPQLSLECQSDFPSEMELQKQINSTLWGNNRYTIRVSAELQLSTKSFSCNYEKFITCRAAGPGASSMVNPEKKIKIAWEGCKRSDTSVEVQHILDAAVIVLLVVFMLIIVLFFVVYKNIHCKPERSSSCPVVYSNVQNHEDP